MGYDVHITRKDDWSSEGPDIPLAEWLAVVESDPEMRLDNFAEASTPAGDVLRYKNAGLAVWAAYSQTAWFDYRDEQIVVKNPDQAILVKMWSIAQRLSANVQGDEGESYGRDGTQIS